MLVKKQHLLASLRKTERNIFVPFSLATGFFEELSYLDESSQFDLSAKDIEIVSGVGNSSTSGSIYGISESSFTGKALNNLTVKNSNGGYAIRIYGNANVDLETDNQLSVESALEKTAISISQSDNKNARISLRGG